MSSGDGVVGLGGEVKLGLGEQTEMPKNRSESSDGGEQGNGRIGVFGTPFSGLDSISI